MVYLQLCIEFVQPGLEVGVWIRGGRQASPVYVQGAQGGVRRVCPQLLRHQLGYEAGGEGHGVCLGVSCLLWGWSQVWGRHMHLCTKPELLGWRGHDSN